MTSEIEIPNKELFRLDEVAAILNMKSTRTVYEWIRRGKIRYIRTPGGQRRIPRKELERIAVALREADGKEEECTL